MITEDDTQEAEMQRLTGRRGGPGRMAQRREVASAEQREAERVAARPERFTVDLEGERLLALVRSDARFVLLRDKWLEGYSDAELMQRHDIPSHTTLRRELQRQVEHLRKQ